jgi:prophage regulatory protein
MDNSKKALTTPEQQKEKSRMKPIYIDLPAVIETVSLAESTIQRMIREGEFPKPRKISAKRVGWLVREIEEWAETRPVSDQLPPPNTGRNE